MSKKTKFNRNIEASLVGDWQMDYLSGCQYFANYLQDLILLESSPNTSLSDLKMSERRTEELQAVQVKTPSTSQNITIVSMEGAMRSKDSLSHYGVNHQISQINEAARDPEVAAIVVKFNSGGGEGLAGSKFFNSIKDAQTIKPVYVHSYTLGSAAYKAALPAKKIFSASSDSRTGSIGAYVSIDKGFLAYYQANFTELYSKLSPDKNKEIRELEKGNEVPFINYITGQDQLFMDQVTSARENVAPKALLGGMFSAKEAGEMGLIDGVLTEQELILYIEQDLKNSDNTNNMFTFNLKEWTTALASKFTWSTEQAESVKDGNDLLNLVKEEKTLEVKISEAVKAANEPLTQKIKELENSIALKETASKESEKTITSTLEATNQLLLQFGKKVETLEVEKKDLEAKVAQKIGEVAPSDQNSNKPNIDAVEKTFQGLLTESEPVNEAQYTDD